MNHTCVTSDLGGGRRRTQRSHIFPALCFILHVLTFILEIFNDALKIAVVKSLLKID